MYFSIPFLHLKFSGQPLLPWNGIPNSFANSVAFSMIKFYGELEYLNFLRYNMYGDSAAAFKIFSGFFKTVESEDGGVF